MRRFDLSLAVLLNLWIAPFGTWAAECETTSEVDPETGERILRVNSQEQLDIFGDDCTTLNGHILIESDYSGDFVLNGVSEIKGNISAPLSGYGDKLGAFELLDLATINAIFLPKVVNVRLPSLEYAGSIYLEQSDVGEVDLGSLTEAGHVEVAGDWTSINLDSLQRATQVEIAGTSTWALLENEEPVNIKVNLPALESANYVGVSGLFESLSLPHLTTVGEHPTGIDYPYGIYGNSRPFEYRTGRPALRISSGNHLLIEVPELSFLNGSLEVYGNITTFRLPSLGESDVNIEFNTDTPIEIFSTIKSTGYFWLWGNLGSIDLPEIEHVDSLSINYRNWLPCNETLVKLWSWVPEGSSPEHRCRIIFPEFLDEESNDDSDNGNNDDDTDAALDDGEGEDTNNNTDTDTDTDTNDDTGDTGSPDNANDENTTDDTPSNDSPVVEEDDSANDSTNNSTDSGSNEAFDGSGSRIVSQPGVVAINWMAEYKQRKRSKPPVATP